MDLLAATDIRVCTRDAWFQVKEVDMGLAADVGTLQRLPKIIGSQSLVNELCLTARKLPAAEAASCGLVSTVYETREEMMAGALGLAATIASKSPVAVQGTKMALVYARDHSTEEGLEQVARYNMVMLQSEDLMKSAMAQMDKSRPPPTASSSKSPLMRRRAWWPGNVSRESPRRRPLPLHQTPRTGCRFQ